MAIDISDSMVDEIDRVKEYVKRFLSALPPDARVTLVVFNDHFFVLAPPSVDLAGRLKALDHLAPWGATSLHEAIVKSFDLLGRGRRAPRPRHLHGRRRHDEPHLERCGRAAVGNERRRSCT